MPVFGQHHALNQEQAWCLIHSFNQAPGDGGVSRYCLHGLERDVQLADAADEYFDGIESRPKS
jgi:hypothetical protein